MSTPETDPAPGGAAPAVVLPVAKVVVDSPLPQLDRLFDYRVPPELDAAARPGVRVKVRFANRLTSGFLLERVAHTDHAGILAPLAKVVSAEPVLAAEVSVLARRVADRGAGTLSDVLRLAIPPRHARVEKAEPRAGAPVPPAPEGGSWSRYPRGAAFLTALAQGRAPRAVWAALPGPSWPDELAVAVQACVSGGRGALLLVPDAPDAERVAAALRTRIGTEAFVVLTADLGPAERYRRFLAVRRGAVRAVVGTRAAAFAPVADLGLVAIWDDGDDLFDEQRAPYPNARDVLALRAHQSGAGVLIGGHAPSVEAVALVESGWASMLTADRAGVHAVAPRVEVAGSDFDLVRDPAARSARLPDLAFAALRAALDAGRPALLQVPRRGYQVGFSCTDCRAPARCARCGGPLARAAAGRLPGCGWCGRPSADWVCPFCQGTSLRSGVVGERRTAEELGRAFPGAAVLTSSGDTVHRTLPPEPALVVATPGAEPSVEGGYGAVVLLDAWSLLGRPDLRAGETALRRWCHAASLAVPAVPAVPTGGPGGRVVLVGADAGLPAVQALVRWAPLWFADSELRNRRALGFPPTTRMAAVEGPAAAAAELVAEVLADVTVADVVDVLGPMPVDDATERLLLRVPRSSGAALASSVAAVQRARSTRRNAAVVRVRFDPAEIG